MLMIDPCIHSGCRLLKTGIWGWDFARCKNIMRTTAVIFYYSHSTYDSTLERGMVYPNILHIPTPAVWENSISTTYHSCFLIARIITKQALRQTSPTLISRQQRCLSELLKVVTFSATLDSGWRRPKQIFVIHNLCGTLKEGQDRSWANVTWGSSGLARTVCTDVFFHRTAEDIMRGFKWIITGRLAT